jgi:hypothetical protein
VPPTKDKRRDLTSYRAAVRRLKMNARRHDWPCSICGEPFDWSLPYYDAMACTADHVAPLATGGAILGPLRPAHRRCNSRRGDGTKQNRLPTTRQW